MEGGAAVDALEAAGGFFGEGPAVPHKGLYRRLNITDLKQIKTTTPLGFCSDITTVARAMDRDGVLAVNAKCLDEYSACLGECITRNTLALTICETWTRRASYGMQ